MFSRDEPSSSGQGSPRTLIGEEDLETLEADLMQGGQPRHWSTMNDDQRRMLRNAVSDLPQLRVPEGDEDDIDDYHERKMAGAAKVLRAVHEEVDASLLDLEEWAKAVGEATRTRPELLLAPEPWEIEMLTERRASFRQALAAVRPDLQQAFPALFGEGIGAAALCLAISDPASALTLALATTPSVELEATVENLPFKWMSEVIRGEAATFAEFKLGYAALRATATPDIMESGGSNLLAYESDRVLLTDGPFGRLMRCETLEALFELYDNESAGVVTSSPTSPTGRSSASVDGFVGQVRGGSGASNVLVWSDYRWDTQQGVEQRADQAEASYVPSHVRRAVANILRFVHAQLSVGCAAPAHAMTPLRAFCDAQTPFAAGGLGAQASVRIPLIDYVAHQLEYDELPSQPIVKHFIAHLRIRRRRVLAQQDNPVLGNPGGMNSHLNGFLQQLNATAATNPDNPRTEWQGRGRGRAAGAAAAAQAARRSRAQQATNDTYLGLIRQYIEKLVDACDGTTAEYDPNLRDRAIFWLAADEALAQIAADPLALQAAGVAVPAAAGGAGAAAPVAQPGMLRWMRQIGINPAEAGRALIAAMFHPPSFGEMARNVAYLATPPSLLIAAQQQRIQMQLRRVYVGGAAGIALLATFLSELLTWAAGLPAEFGAAVGRVPGRLIAGAAGVEMGEWIGGWAIFVLVYGSLLRYPLPRLLRWLRRQLGL